MYPFDRTQRHWYYDHKEEKFNYDSDDDFVPPITFNGGGSCTGNVRPVTPPPTPPPTDPIEDLIEDAITLPRVFNTFCATSKSGAQTRFDRPVESENITLTQSPTISGATLRWGNTTLATNYQVLIPFYKGTRDPNYFNQNQFFMKFSMDHPLNATVRITAVSPGISPATQDVVFVPGGGQQEVTLVVNINEPSLVTGFNYLEIDFNLLTTPVNPFSSFDLTNLETEMRTDLDPVTVYPIVGSGFYDDAYLTFRTPTQPPGPNNTGFSNVGYAGSFGNDPVFQIQGNLSQDWLVGLSLKDTSLTNTQSRINFTLDQWNRYYGHLDISLQNGTTVLRDPLPPVGTNTLAPLPAMGRSQQGTSGQLLQILMTTYHDGGDPRPFGNFGFLKNTAGGFYRGLLSFHFQHWTELPSVTGEASRG